MLGSFSRQYLSDGIYRNNSNQVLVKCSTVMGVTPKMVDWWFAWHMSKADIVTPRDHISTELKEDRSSFKSDKEKYIG